MSNEQSNEQQPQVNPEIEALNKKTVSIDDKLAQIANQIEQMNKLNQNSAHAQSLPNNNQNKKPDAVLEPEAYEAYMEQKMEAKLNSRFQAQAQQQQQIASLVNMYPELSDSSSDLTKSALQVFNSLSQDEKSSPLAYKIAVQDAALNLGLLPKNKRSAQKASNDSTDLGSGSSSSRQSSQQGSKKDKLDNATLAFAQALGKDINDPKYLERLEKAAGRKDWSRSKSKGEY